MSKVGHFSHRFSTWCLIGLLSAAIPSVASAQTPAPASGELSTRIGDLEKRLSELTPNGAETAVAAVAQPAAQRNPQAPAANTQAMPNMPMPAGPTAGDPQNPLGAPPDSTDPAALLDRIKRLEDRTTNLESSAVLSEPETRVKKVEVYVDKNGVQHDQPVDGAKKEVTYQRERVYRRQTINEKIEEALSDAAEHNVQVGVNAGIVAQFAHRVKTVGSPVAMNNHAYELASADLFFTAGIAQNTMFFADVVGLSGPPPDLELGTITLVNGYSARLVNQNELNLREAWLRTELFSNRVAVTAGRLDLTNYFDHNMAANDETSQFLSDALVNNPALGLANNGAGLAVVYDPKNGINFKIGFQQSNTDAVSLSESIYSLAELGYLARLPGMGQGNYRFWYRTDNNNTAGYNIGFGTSVDQKVGPQVTLFARYGESQAMVKRDHFYSGGLELSQGLGFYPGDKWGMGYAQTDLQIGGKERMVEGYYNFSLAEKLNVSFHVQHFLELPDGATRLGYLVPGIRLQASF
ncbi:MAG TPA: carbohydrate porin [Terriglobia bacterium]|nr:carbohydrate porin [Terriglobia bacterium]